MKKPELIKVGSMLLVTAALLATNPSSAMSLNEYLDQVKQHSLGLKASDEQAEASQLATRDADLYFTPKLFADARVGRDGKLPFGSTIQYDRINLQNYSLGVSQEFNFGLQTKLSYAVSRTEVQGATLPPEYAGMPTTFWEATPVLELSLPLWKDGFGRTARANQELSRSGNEAAALGAQAQSQSFIIEAEAAYWNLAAAQEVVEVQTRASKQAQSILDYVSRKARMNLGENADVLQARALVEATTFQLQQAVNAEKASRRSFNTYLNRSSEESVTKLENLNYGSMQNVAVPTAKPGSRLDVLAAEAQARQARASARVAAEKNRPSLDLYGSYALFGRDTEMNEAMKAAGHTERDTAVVGLRLNMPLNFGAAADQRAGALKAEKAAEYNYQYKQFVQEQDWNNLVEQLAEAKEGFRLASNIVNAQKAKLDNERVRLRQGRTTTYQVLLFEQDFSQSEVTRVRSAAQILNLQARIKLYQNSPEGGK